MENKGIDAICGRVLCLLREPALFARAQKAIGQMAAGRGCRKGERVCFSPEILLKGR